MARILNQNRTYFITIAIVILISIGGMYLRFQQRSNSGINPDEYYQVLWVTLPLQDAILHIRRYVQFPGDYLLTYPFYRLFGRTNKWGLAVPHIITTIFGFYLLYFLCKRYFKTSWGYIITFTVFSFNYNLILHAFEIRPYSVLVTLGIGTYLVIQYIFENEDPAFKKRVLISIFIFTTLLFHLYGLFLLFFSYLYHLLYSRGHKSIKDIFIKHFKYYGVAVIIALPIWYYFVSAETKGFGVSRDTFQFINKGAIPIIRGVVGNLVGSRKLYFLLLGLIAAFFLPHKERLKQIMFFVILIMVPIGLILFSCAINGYWFIQRLFIWAIPWFAFLLGWCWDSLISHSVTLWPKLKKIEMKL